MIRIWILILTSPIHLLWIISLSWWKWKRLEILTWWHLSIIEILSWINYWLHLILIRLYYWWLIILSWIHLNLKILSRLNLILRINYYITLRNLRLIDKLRIHHIIVNILILHDWIVNRHLHIFIKLSIIHWISNPFSIYVSS